MDDYKNSPKYKRLSEKDKKLVDSIVESGILDEIAENVVEDEKKRDKKHILNHI